MRPALRRAGFAAAVSAVLPLMTALAGAQGGGPPVVAGRVAEVFANRLILDMGGERVLVEPTLPDDPLAVGVGDMVGIEGQRFGAVVKATRITLQARAAEAPPPPRTGGGRRDADLAKAVEALGLGVVDPPLRKKHHIEILAQTREGRKLYVSFDREGRLWEIEDAAYDRDAARPKGLGPDDYLRLAREAGFAPTGGIEERRRHVEVEASNRAGEALTLHIDRAGIIYKQVWRR
jgi:hypothetical protein